jgi:hypothetical protein
MIFQSRDGAVTETRRGVNMSECCNYDQPYVRGRLVRKAGKKGWYEKPVRARPGQLSLIGKIEINLH